MGIILASTSKYRRDALARLNVSFDCVAPNVDETPKPAEHPAALARRLAKAKCRAVCEQAPDQIILGSDQVGSMGQQRLGKPGGRTRQIEQLRQLSGAAATFYTALAVWNPKTKTFIESCDQTHLKFRQLSDAQIEHYVNQEPAFDCAGGFKVEGLGISLFTSIRTQDPSALVGLPLIAVVDALHSIAQD